MVSFEANLGLCDPPRCLKSSVKARTGLALCISNLASCDPEFSSAGLKHISSSGQEFQINFSASPDPDTANKNLIIYRKVFHNWN